MKVYTFINSYICGIQVGIQAGHSNVELVKDADCNAEVRRWADDHKTFIWLDGGDSISMNHLARTLLQSSLPYAKFYEPGLDGLMTSVSVLLNESQCDYVDLLRGNKGHKIHNDFRRGHVVLSASGDVLIRVGELTLEDMLIISLIAESRLKSL